MTDRRFACAFVASLCAWLALPAAPTRAQETPDAPPVEAPADSSTPPVEAPQGEAPPVEAESDGLDLPGVAWVDGPMVGKLGDVATIAVPDGYRFTDGDGTRKLLEAWGNLTGGSELGMVSHRFRDEQGRAGDFEVVFQFAKVGKVKDDETLDADEMLKQMKESDGPTNEERKKAGLPALETVRFTTPPHYDSVTHNLEWGILLRSDEGGETVNYNVKLLGRYGFVSMTLLCRPDLVDRVLPEFRKLIPGCSFAKGKSYAEWTKGDPVADFGISALVMGGAAAVAWKFGLFKYMKGIVVALFAGVAAIWKKITGRGKKTLGS